MVFFKLKKFLILTIFSIVLEAEIKNRTTIKINQFYKKKKIDIFVRESFQEYTVVNLTSYSPTL